MFKPILLLALIAFVASVPVRVEDETEVPEVVAILKSEQQQNPDGSYNFLFESADGSSRTENGEITNQGTDEEGIKITGSYRYIDADGQEVLVTYTADENGFVPIGSNIPKEISDAALAAKDLPNEEPAQEQPRAQPQVQAQPQRQSKSIEAEVEE